MVRSIERGSGSTFRVNGKEVRARDVQLLFADAATGAHSTALVSQGRVGALINAKPTDRRAILEEAAGIICAVLHSHLRDQAFPSEVKIVVGTDEDRTVMENLLRMREW